jgi:hypothetical protein
MKQTLWQWQDDNYRRWLSGWMVGMMSWGLVCFPATAVRFADGTVQFAGVPRLGKVSTTNNQAWAWGATYLFTLQVPPDASEPLGRIVLQQAEGVDTVDFNLKRTYAYLNGDRRQKVELDATKDKSAHLNLRFKTPVPPGNTVTFGLRPYNNPSVGGVYLFGVTTFPEGEKVRSQFVGYGRLQFYENSFFHQFGFGWP